MTEDDPAVPEKAGDILPPFSMPYLCVQAHLCLICMKSKDRNCLISGKNRIMCKFSPAGTTVQHKSKHRSQTSEGHVILLVSKTFPIQVEAYTRDHKINIYS